MLLIPISVSVPASHECVASLKGKKPHSKVLMTLRAVDAYSIFVSSGIAKLKDFCQCVVAFLRRHDFDGLDVEWKVVETSGVFFRLFQVGYIEHRRSNGVASVAVTADILLRFLNVPPPPLSSPAPQMLCIFAYLRVYVYVSAHTGVCVRRERERERERERGHMH